MALVLPLTAPECPLSPATIAAALDTGLPLGSGFICIAEDVEVRLFREPSPHAERITLANAFRCCSLATAALRRPLRYSPEPVGPHRPPIGPPNSAAYAIATIAGRAGAAAVLSAEPNLAAIIRDHWRSEG